MKTRFCQAVIKKIKKPIGCEQVVLCHSPEYPLPYKQVVPLCSTHRKQSAKNKIEVYDKEAGVVLF